MSYTVGYCMPDDGKLIKLLRQLYLGDIP
jgi:hypothetical protein